MTSAQWTSKLQAIVVATLATSLGGAGMFVATGLYAHASDGELFASRAREIVGWGGIFALHFGLAGLLAAGLTMAFASWRPTLAPSWLRAVVRCVMAAVVGAGLYSLAMAGISGAPVELESFLLALAPGLFAAGIATAWLEERVRGRWVGIVTFLALAAAVIIGTW